MHFKRVGGHRRLCRPPGLPRVNKERKTAGRPQKEFSYRLQKEVAREACGFLERGPWLEQAGARQRESPSVSGSAALPPVFAATTGQPQGALEPTAHSEIWKGEGWGVQSSWGEI